MLDGALKDLVFPQGVSGSLCLALASASLDIIHRSWASLNNRSGALAQRDEGRHSGRGAGDLGEIPISYDNLVHYSKVLLSTHYYQKSLIRGGGWPFWAAVYKSLGRD